MLAATLTRKTNGLRNNFKCIEAQLKITRLLIFPIMHYGEMASGKISSNELINIYVQINPSLKFTTKLS